MLDNCEVLGLGLELLVRILAWTKHVLLRSHLGHLLSHLVCG